MGDQSSDVQKTLGELAQRVRKNMPDSKNLKSVDINNDAKIVTFRWHERMFVVTPQLRVSELKGSNLLMTGNSILIQAILTGKAQNEQYIDAASRAIEEAGELARAQHFETMKQKLDAAKSMLRRIIGSAAAAAAKAK